MIGLQVANLQNMASVVAEGIHSAALDRSVTPGDHEKKVKIELIPGRGQSGHGAVVQMGGWGTLRQRVTDTCTGDRIFRRTTKL